MELKNKISSTIEKGLKFLEKEQKKDEHFGFETLFPSVLILDCLNTIENEKSREIRNKLVEVLLKEKSKFWSFNYWFRDSKKYQQTPYPDDLDDTFCALSAINNFDKTIIKGEDLVNIVNLLVLCEEKEGGPYRTWILPKEKSKNWDDVDVAVNSNIAYFLKSQEIELENVNKFIEKKIKNDDLISPYYKGKLPIVYFISRFYKGKLAEKLIRTEKDKTILDRALRISSLIRLGMGNLIENKWIEEIIEKQAKNGGWEKQTFYLDGKTEMGSESLTTAFVLEALTLYQEAQKKMVDSKDGEYRKKIISKIKEAFASFPKEIKKELEKETIGLVEKDRGVVLTPFFMTLSLKEKYRNKISEDFLIKLGLINVYGWAAYTLYDNIWDGDEKMNRLPLANIYCREMDILFNNLEIDSKTGFFDFYKQMMQQMETANYWELNGLRGFNKCENLWQKSAGHILTPVAIWCYLGFAIESIETQSLIKFFKNFLITKQMNDDMHDWQNDLKNGLINSAGKEILDLMKKKKIEKKILTKKGEILFFQEIIPHYCQKIMELGQKGQENLQNTGIIEKESWLTKIMLKNMKVAKKTMEERDKTLNFIKKYYS